MTASQPSDLQLLLSLDFTVRLDPKTEKPLKWLKDKSVVAALVEAVLSLPVCADMRFAEVDEIEPFAGLKAAKALVATGRVAIVKFQDSDQDQADVVARLAVRDGAFELWIRATGEPLAKHRSTIIDQFTNLAARLRDLLEGTAGLDIGYITAAYRVRPFRYLRDRPPRWHDHYPGNSIVDLLDTRFHQSAEPGARPDDIAALTKKPAPPARIAEAGGLMVIRWAESADEAEVIRAAGEHERWIAERLSPALAEGFNADGDQLEDRWTLEARPPLTLYSPMTHIGYKAVVVFPDGTIEESAWKDALRIAKAKALPDGSPVAEVRIVVPNRDLTFAVAEQAAAAGFTAVVYPDDRGSFWNPDPPGPWRSPPTGPKSAKPLKSKKAPRA
ncbi:MAG: hypothetical protein JNK64_03855 [Myxococcales bacterium]|nr:hypothetical protein [Myxococcales bacterium]